MLSRELLRDSPGVVRAAYRNRNAQVDLDRFLELEAERRRIITNVESRKGQRNSASQEVSRLKKEKGDASALIESTRKLGAEIGALDQQLTAVENELHELEMTFPNIPDATVPIGADESANRLERSWGTPRAFEFKPKPHWEIGEELGIIDFERASKIAGARFSVLVGAGAQLERAIISFMLDLHTSRHGYTEVLPPVIVNADSLRGTGQLPKFGADLFKLEGEKDYYLIPTAEVPVTNLHRDEIFQADQLPLSYCAFTPCFRSEAGSYGKDTRGLIRQHQFDKVELVKFTRPSDSWDQLEKLTRHAAAVLEELELPYRVMTLSTGDIGFAAAKTYDLEVWLPGQDAYREISSCSNFLDFQARRANIRVRGDGKKPELVHTLNGSGLAVGRTMVAILENYQQADGSVVIPKALRGYMGGREAIRSESKA